jgi:hypothetical protein
MTVSQLIARLQALDPDLKVVMPSEDEDWCEVGGAYVDIFRFRGRNAQMSDETSPGHEHVVRLFEPDD